MIRWLLPVLALITIGAVSGYAQTDIPDGRLVGCNRPCLAQNDPMDEPGQPPYGLRSGERGDPERRGRKIELLRTAKLMELLKLDADREAKFVPIYRRYREDQRGLRDNRDRVINELARGLKENRLTREEIGPILGQIDELRRQEGALTDRFHADIEPILSPEQMGKLYVFEERFEREVLQRMAKFRGGRGGMMAPGGPGDDSMMPDDDNKESDR